MRKKGKWAWIPVLLLVLGCVLAPSRAAERAIYPSPERAAADLAAGLKAAQANHRRVILDFGGDWCGDCQVLDQYFHNPANKPILDANYVLVHINVGHMDANKALASRYGVVLGKGVPVLVVLDEHGKIVFSQRTPVFEAAKGVQPTSVTEFLVKWKPVKPGCSAVRVVC